MGHRTPCKCCRKFAWGHDEVGPGSHQIKEWFGLGVTIVDSLDTLLILGLKEEYAEARQWVAHHFDPEAKRVSVSSNMTAGTLLSWPATGVFLGGHGGHASDDCQGHHSTRLHRR